MNGGIFDSGVSPSFPLLLPLSFLSFDFLCLSEKRNKSGVSGLLGHQERRVGGGGGETRRVTTGGLEGFFLSLLLPLIFLSVSSASQKRERKAGCLDYRDTRKGG